MQEKASKIYPTLLVLLDSILNGTHLHHANSKSILYIRTLTYRCFRICSTASLLQSAIEDLKRLLLQNGYPQGIITFNINDVLNKNENKPNVPVATVPKNYVIVLLPYIGLHSNLIPKRLKSCINRFYSFVNVKVIFQNTRRIKSFFPYKDCLNRTQFSKVIYKATIQDKMDEKLRPPLPPFQ